MEKKANLMDNVYDKSISTNTEYSSLKRTLYNIHAAATVPTLGDSVYTRLLKARRKKKHIHTIYRRKALSVYMPDIGSIFLSRVSLPMLRYQLL
jgi:hypothetical protein